MNIRGVLREERIDGFSQCQFAPIRSSVEVGLEDLIWCFHDAVLTVAPYTCIKLTTTLL